MAQLGLRFEDLKLIDMGFVFDMMVEAGNDHCEYNTVAQQSDFDSF